MLSNFTAGPGQLRISRNAFSDAQSANAVTSVDVTTLVNNVNVTFQ